MIKKLIRKVLKVPKLFWLWAGKNVSSIISVLAFAFSIYSLSIAQTNTERSERAYVFVRPGNVYNVSDGKTPEPRIMFSNSGNTAAEKTQRWARAIISPPKSNKELEALGLGTLEEGVLNVPPRVPHAIIRYSEQLKSGEREKIANPGGPLRLYVYGRVEYLDIFKKPHFTNFCFIYYGEQQIWSENGGPEFNSTQARYCSVHNDAK